MLLLASPYPLLSAAYALSIALIGFNSSKSLILNLGLGSFAFAQLWVLTGAPATRLQPPSFQQNPFRPAGGAAGVTAPGKKAEEEAPLISFD